MLTLFILAAAATAQTQLNCKSPVTQADMDTCSYKDAQAADAAMVSEYKIAKVILGNMDRDIDRKYDKRPSYSAALLTSQRAWLAFRKAECEIEAEAARGGSMEPMLANLCYQEVTEERTKQLRAMLQSYSGD